MPGPRRIIKPEIIPGVSITRFHLAVENSMRPDSSTEIHASHYPDGDLTERAQWYNFYEHPRDEQLELLRWGLEIDEEDWKILEHLLGSFFWAMYFHPKPPHRAKITIDEKAMKDNEWATTYF